MILLGCAFRNAVFVMKEFLASEAKLCTFETILIKIHPARYYDEKMLEDALGIKLPEQYKFVNEPLEEFVNRIKRAFCAASGVSVELVLRGIPTVTVAEPYGLTMDYLSGGGENQYYRFCFSRAEIQKAFTEFNSYAESQSRAIDDNTKKLRNSYIAPFDSKYWKSYLIV